MTVELATAFAGIEIDVVTSASGEIAVVTDALSGNVLVPSLVAVLMLLVVVTEPLVGAVYAMLIVRLEPAPRIGGIPEKVTAPLAGLYDAIAPGGRLEMVTPARPGGRPIEYVIPVAVDGPLLP